jgi:hypothetical protein
MSIRAALDTARPIERAIRGAARPAAFDVIVARDTHAATLVALGRRRRTIRLIDAAREAATSGRVTGQSAGAVARAVALDATMQVRVATLRRAGTVVIANAFEAGSDRRIAMQ